MEQIQMERATREATQRMSDQKAKREDKVYVSGVESGRIADGIQKKEEEKLKRRLESEQDGEAKQTQKPARKIRRTFEQSKAVKNDDKIADDTQRVLGKIF
jgi:ESF2/ABP1 family protein